MCKRTPLGYFYYFFEGGPFTHGSWWGNIVNRNPPRGEGVSFDQSAREFAELTEKEEELVEKEEEKKEEEEKEEK